VFKGESLNKSEMADPVGSPINIGASLGAGAAPPQKQAVQAQKSRKKETEKWYSKN
jgi:hypothetical protein